MSVHITSPIDGEILHHRLGKVGEDIVHDMLEVCTNRIHPAREIVPHLEMVANKPKHCDVISVIIHEQYFYPDYKAYMPDYKKRCEIAIRWLTEQGYKPVLYDDGFLGAPID